MMTYGVLIVLVAILISGLVLLLAAKGVCCKPSKRDDPKPGTVNLTCGFCGHVHTEHAHFCGHCGERLND